MWEQFSLSGVCSTVDCALCRRLNKRTILLLLNLTCLLLILLLLCNVRTSSSWRLLCMNDGSQLRSRTCWLSVQFNLVQNAGRWQQARSYTKYIIENKVVRVLTLGAPKRLPTFGTLIEVPNVGTRIQVLSVGTPVRVPTVKTITCLPTKRLCPSFLILPHINPFWQLNARQWHYSSM